MPRMYRVMKQAKHELKPEIGDAAIKLGVRERDLAPEHGHAPPGKGGLSVVSCIAGFRRRMTKGLCPPTMVPNRLHNAGRIPGAIGDNTLHLFRHGDGQFATGPVTAQLFLVLDRDDHGTVQPVALMPYDQYRQAIVETRDDWVSGEADPDE
jgi:hypothetical protein